MKAAYFPLPPFVKDDRSHREKKKRKDVKGQIQTQVSEDH